MTPPNMAAITASLQTSLQNCSLDTNTAGGAGFATSSPSSSSISNHHSSSSSDATLELNSSRSLPYHWEQCLDLKTGEVFYIHWKTRMKAKEDPRMADHGFYSDDDDDNEENQDEEEGFYDEEGSSSESSSPVSSSNKHNQNNVLVVAGCKSCFMYFMVAKQVEECPKCNGTSDEREGADMIRTHTHWSLCLRFWGDVL
ncbi:protein CURLY FLAG LEAF 1 isoform X1 [Lactuca sativa]|uniref:protein CURLY FLAG LEAF 1 isoform X1 n=1 Tax=Lactuca sativa TaxID=4236 RepID=UPI0022AF5585|nr:protein CURLY FLAG LEAF 1 isoform X1 [Lactuca sativa]